MTAADPIAQVLELSAELCNGTLDAEGVARLETLLTEHPEAMQTYLEYLDLHADLIGTAAAVPAEMLAAARAPSPSFESAVAHEATAARSVPEKRRQKALTAVLIAASLLLAVRLTVGTEGYLIRKLESGPTAQRLSALHELSMIGSPRALRAIARHARDGETDVARHALLSLGRRDWPEAIATLARAQLDGRPAVREAALAALARHDRRRIDPKLILGVLRHDDAPSVRAAAAHTAGATYLWDAMPQLIAAMRDPNARVRGRAAHAVRQLLGVDHGYRPNAAIAERERVVREIERVWRNFHGHHLAYLERLEDKP